MSADPDPGPGRRSPRYYDPMLATLVMTVIGADQPGLVQKMAARVADHGGNWLESRMCRLGGQFAGILRVEVAKANRDGLVEALRHLEYDGLSVIIHPEADLVGQNRVPAEGGALGADRQAGSSLVTVELVGTDRPGILLGVSGVFAAHGLNVEELASERVNAPMGGDDLFQARATVYVPPHVKLSVVRSDLERIAADLMVDLKVLPRG